MNLRLSKEILDLSNVDNSLDDFHYKGEQRDEVITEGRNHDPPLVKFSNSLNALLQFKSSSQQTS